jgi:hypothetical protein
MGDRVVGAALVERASSTASTPSVLRGHPLSAREPLTPEVVALAWIDHLEKGGSVPDAGTLLEVLKAVVVSRVPLPIVSARARTDLSGVRMVLQDTGSKFPHVRDTEQGRFSHADATWTQCKTKMTHIAFRLVDSNGKSVAGSTVQQGGLVLRLTLHKVSDVADTLDDDNNPRPQEGLFLGRGGTVFDPVVCLTESRHEFRFQVLLLSSDIGGARMFLKIAPADPQLALNPNLVVQSRSFISRARMPDGYTATRTKRTNAASHLLSMALGSGESDDPFPAETRAALPSKRHCGVEQCSGVAETDPP